MKLMKNLHKGFAICVIIMFFASTVCFADNGDIWKNSKNSGGIMNMILHDKPSLFDMIRHIDNYTYEIDGYLYKVRDVNKEFDNIGDRSIADIYSTIKTTKTNVGVAASVISIDTLSSQDVLKGVVPVLPGTVSAKLSNGKTVQATITWETKASRPETYQNSGIVNITGVLNEYWGYPVNIEISVDDSVLNGNFSELLGKRYAEVDMPSGKTIKSISVNGINIEPTAYSIDNNVLTIIGVTATDNIIVTTSDSMNYKIKGIIGDIVLEGNFSELVGKKYAEVTMPSGKTIKSISVNGTNIDTTTYSIENNVLTILGVSAEDTIIVTTTDSINYKIKGTIKDLVLNGNFSELIGKKYAEVILPPGKTIKSISVNGTNIDTTDYSIENNVLTIMGVTVADTIIVTTVDSINYKINGIIGNTVLNGNFSVLVGKKFAEVTIPTMVTIKSISVNGTNIDTTSYSIENNVLTIMGVTSTDCIIVTTTDLVNYMIKAGV